MNIKFTKMQGLGNDFVIINNTAQKISLSAKQIRKIADRHFGVGCDQLLILGSQTSSKKNVDFTYRVFNADGSEAEQCGNGVRCLAKFVVTNGLTRKKDLVFATKFCKMQTYLESDGRVTVVIAPPVFDPKKIPLKMEKKALHYSLPVDGYGKIEIGAVSVGNPHAVVLLQKDIADHIEHLGPIISKSKYFPEGANINFMKVLNRKRIELRVYERGSGETLACGSGAAASVAVGRLWGLLDSTVVVKLPGGNLLVKWEGSSNHVQVTGPAEPVFNGQIILKGDL